MIDLRHVLGRRPNQIPSNQADLQKHMFFQSLCFSKVLYVYQSQTHLISSARKVSC